MTIALPRVVQTPSPNYTPTLIKHDLFVFHDEEGESDPSITWLCDPRAEAASHHAMNDDGSVLTQLVPLQFKAWAQCAFNSRGISLEMPGFVARGFPDARLRAAAIIGAWHCLAYSIPPVWAQGGQGRGICCHHDLGAAGGGHIDVGPVGGDTWQTLVKYTQGAYADLKALPSLPGLALHGLPGPHEVVAPPDVTASPSHGGAPRNEPGDVHAHPTPSLYPAHSIAALQADLNAILGAGLVVDGRFGKLTRAALMRFQLMHGCDVDGQIGPQTWAAVDGVLTKKAA